MNACLLALAMIIGGGPSCYGQVSTTTPAWLVGKAVNEVVSIAGTDLLTAVSSGGTLYSVLNSKGLLTSFGAPSYGVMEYSGGSVKLDTSELMIHGGGGANASADNGVRGIVLESDTPRWHFVIEPTTSADVINGSGDHYTDNKPNSAHSYWGPMYADAPTKFFRFRTFYVWNSDLGEHSRLNSGSYGGLWDDVGTRADVAVGKYNNAHYVVKNPSTGKIWVGGNDGSTGVLREYNPTTDTWGTNHSLSSFFSGQGCACLDHTRDIVMNFDWQLPKALTINLTTGTETEAVLSGPEASVLAGVNTPIYSMGMVYDSGLDRGLLCHTNGNIYTLQYLSAASWYVDKLALSVNLTTLFTELLLYGRFQYMPRLSGVAIIDFGVTGLGSANVAFIKTS